MEFVVQNGDLVTWRVVVRNTSTYTTATSVLATLTYPAGLAYDSHIIPLGSFNSGTGEWTIGSLFPQQVLEMTIVFTVTDIAQAPYTLEAEVTAAQAEITLVDNTTLNTVYAICDVIGTCTADLATEYICEEFSPGFGLTQVTVVNSAKAGYDPVVFRNGKIVPAADYTKVGNVYTFGLAFGNSGGADYSETVKICQHV